MNRRLALSTLVLSSICSLFLNTLYIFIIDDNNVEKNNLDESQILRNFPSSKNKKRISPPPNVTIPIVVPLSTAMGNYLSRISRGVALQLLAQREYGIRLTLVMRPDPKYNKGQAEGPPPAEIDKCFPNLRRRVPVCSSFEYSQRLEQQQTELGSMGGALHIMNGIKSVAVDADIDRALRTLQDVLVARRTSRANNLFADNTTINHGCNISPPFLTVEGDFVVVDSMADKYYDDFRDAFQFDFQACCKLKPEDDESVLHFRNFKQELGDSRAIRLGFHELDADNTANLLFGHLQAGEKVAIVSPYASNAISMHPYVDAMVNRGLQVRVITNQSGAEDFCFLLHAKKELVGVAESTFTLWAGYLSNASKVRLYSMDNRARRNTNVSLFSHRVFVHFNWTNPKLKQKISFELYKVRNIKKKLPFPK